MAKRLFGRDRDQRKREELEREAAAELHRATGSWYEGQGAPSASSTPSPGRAPPPPPPAVGPGGWGDQTPGWGSADRSPEQSWYPRGGGGRAAAAREEEAVTELALSQWAERRGTDLENLTVARQDATSAEAARDQALRHFLDRKARMPRRRQSQPSPSLTGLGVSPIIGPQISGSGTLPGAVVGHPPGGAWATPEPEEAPAEKRATAKKRAPAKKKAPAKKRATAKKKAPAKKAAPRRR